MRQYQPQDAPVATVVEAALRTWGCPGRIAPGAITRSSRSVTSADAPQIDLRVQLDGGVPPAHGGPKETDKQRSITVTSRAYTAFARSTANVSWPYSSRAVRINACATAHQCAKSRVSLHRPASTAAPARECRDDRVAVAPRGGTLRCHGDSRDTSTAQTPYRGVGLSRRDATP